MPSEDCHAERWLADFWRASRAALATTARLYAPGDRADVDQKDGAALVAVTSGGQQGARRFTLAATQGTGPDLLRQAAVWTIGFRPAKVIGEGGGQAFQI
jgi:hypothetical protein